MRVECTASCSLMLKWDLRNLVGIIWMTKSLTASNKWLLFDLIFFYFLLPLSVVCWMVLLGRVGWMWKNERRIVKRRLCQPETQAIALTQGRENAGSWTEITKSPWAHGVGDRERFQCLCWWDWIFFLFFFFPLFFHPAWAGSLLCFLLGSCWVPARMVPLELGPRRRTGVIV